MDHNGVIVVTTCTNRKRGPVPPLLRASSLKAGSQDDILHEWRSRLLKHPPVERASNIYCGRAFSEACAASDETFGSLWIISAGLGLVFKDDMISPYNFTISGSGQDSVLPKIKGDNFSPSRWWTALNDSKNLGHPISRLVSENPSRLIVIALSQAYAGLIQQDLLTLSDRDLFRVRLIGLSIKHLLDPRLQALVMPYDERFDGSGGTNLGTRSDFAQRAMRHFVTAILPAASYDGDLEVHKELVQDYLSTLSWRQIPKRERLCDQEIMDAILRNWSASSNTSSKMLRIIRDLERIACEQSRFQRLFKLVKEKVSR